MSAPGRQSEGFAGTTGERTFAFSLSGHNKKLLAEERPSKL